MLKLPENQKHESYPSPTSPNLTSEEQFDGKQSKPAASFFLPLNKASLTSPIEPTESDFKQKLLSSAYENAYISSIFNSNQEYTDDLLSLCMMDFDLSPISPAAPPPSPEKNNMMEYLNNESLFPIQQNPSIKIEDPEEVYSVESLHLFEDEDEEDLEEMEIDREVVEPRSIEPAQIFSDTSLSSSELSLSSEVEEPEPSSFQQPTTVIDLFSDSEDEEDITEQPPELDEIPMTEQPPELEKVGDLENVGDLSEYEPDLESEDEPYSPPPSVSTKPQKIKPSSTSPIRYFICPNTDCAKVFNRKYNLNTHIKIHATDRSRPYHCHYCNASFIRFNDLTRHSTSHSKKKAFWCNGCGGGFTRRDALKRHMKMLGCGDISLVGKKADRARLERD